MYYHIDKLGIITHDIPEEYIINSNDIDVSRERIINGYYEYIYYISKNEFNRLKEHCLYPLIPSNSQVYLPRADRSAFIDVENTYSVALIIRNYCADDILTFAYPHRDKNMIVLYPVGHLFCDERAETSYFPNRKIKCFTTYEEFRRAEEKNTTNRDKNYQKGKDARALLHEISPSFSLASPKYKVVAVKKPTQKIKAKVGDIIHAELPIITEDGWRYKYDHTSVNMYVNNQFKKTLLLKYLQMIFLENYVVEEVSVPMKEEM
jgi:hypothetical protein